MPHLPRLLPACISIFAAPLAAAEDGQAEPAGFLLLVLGLIALLLGLKNLRDIRNQRMLPPSAARRRKSDDAAKTPTGQ